MRYVLTWLLSWALWGEACAQREFAAWCFGSDALDSLGASGLTYVSSGRGALVQFPANASPTVGTCQASLASIADEQGNLLFYTNGITIYTRQHQPMLNGSNLTTNVQLGYGAFQVRSQAVITPVPGAAGQYYVFYFTANPPVGTSADTDPVLRFCLVDMRRNGGLGEVMQRGGIVVQRTATIMLRVVRHRNNRDYWLLTRHYFHRSFLAFRISPTGISPQPVESLRDSAAYPQASHLSFKVAPTGTLLVCPGFYADGPQANCQNLCYRDNWGLFLYQFDNSTGRISQETKVKQTQVDMRLTLIPEKSFVLSYFYSACIASAFSPDGLRLYTTEYTFSPAPNNVGRYLEIMTSVCQYNLALPTAESIGNSRLELAQQPNPPPPNEKTSRFWDLQNAPDGTIWLADMNGFSLGYPQLRPDPGPFPKAAGIIRHPNVAGTGCQLDLNAFPYSGQTVVFAFPNVIANMLYAPTAIEAKVSCQDSVRFWANSAQTGPAGRWDFGEPVSGAANYSTGYYVAHRYARSGTYPVTLTYPDGRVLRRVVQVPAGNLDLSNATIFTPNGDGQNDVFRPVLGETGLSGGGRLRVFSRWGQLVYATEEALPKWDGAGAAGGDYFWQLDYPGCDGKPQRRRGVVTLLR